MKMYLTLIILLSIVTNGIYAQNQSLPIKVNIKSNDYVAYEKAINGNLSMCNAYLTSFPNGKYKENVQERKNELIANQEAEKKDILAKQEAKKNEQLRNSKIKANSNKALWKLGSKICNNVNGGIACGSLNAWNEDKSMAQIKIVTSPGGDLDGEQLIKNNLIWIPTSGKGWHICLADEIESSLSDDQSNAQANNNSNNSNNSAQQNAIYGKYINTFAKKMMYKTEFMSSPRELRVNIIKMDIENESQKVFTQCEISWIAGEFLDVHKAYFKGTLGFDFYGCNAILVITETAYPLRSFSFFIISFNVLGDVATAC